MKHLFSIIAFLFCTIAQAQPRLVKVLGQLTNSNVAQWVDSSERLITYNTQGLPNQQIVNYINGGVWQPNSKEISTYNTLGQITTNDIYNWDFNTSSWPTTAAVSTNYQYNTAAAIETINWFYSSNSLTVKDTFIYNTSNQLVAKQNLYTKLLYSYNTSGELTETIMQRYVGANWVDYLRTTHTYTAGVLTSEIEEYWDDKSASWQTNFRYTYTYNSDGTLDVLLKEHLDISTWHNYERHLYFYTTSTGITKINNNIFAIYPNPSTGVFTIADNYGTTNTTLTVYDLAGRQVAQPTIANGSIDLTGIEKGFYLLQLQTNAGTQVSKIKIE